MTATKSALTSDEITDLHTEMQAARRSLRCYRSPRSSQKLVDFIAKKRVAQVRCDEAEANYFAAISEATGAA